MSKLTIFCKKHMNTILSIVSSLGVVSTAVLSGMATYDAVKAINEKKAETKKEKIKVAAPIYIPTVLSGMATNEAKEVVKEHSYSYNYSGGGYGGTSAATPKTDYYGNQHTTPATTQSKPKVGAKQTARYGSAVDDDAPDPLDDEYYSSVYGDGRFGGWR